MNGEVYRSRNSAKVDEHDLLDVVYWVEDMNAQIVCLFMGDECVSRGLKNEGNFERRRKAAVNSFHGEGGGTFRLRSISPSPNIQYGEYSDHNAMLSSADND
jgi:hypothetical protein